MESDENIVQKWKHCCKNKENQLNLDMRRICGISVTLFLLVVLCHHGYVRQMVPDACERWAETAKACSCFQSSWTTSGGFCGGPPGTGHVSLGRLQLPLGNSPQLLHWWCPHCPTPLLFSAHCSQTEKHIWSSPNSSNSVGPVCSLDP